MTIAQALIRADKKLQSKSISSARLDAEVLFGFALNKPREYLLAHGEKYLTPAEQKKCSALIGRRAKHEPVAYIIGSKEFYGLKLKVNKNALIPRPETELLVDEIIALAPPQGAKTAILDIGAGSGAIALALAKRLPQAKIWALEASADALNLAKFNAKELRLKISFIKSDLLKNAESKIINGAILAANLPYLDKDETKNFPLEIKRGLKYEPAGALYAKNRGTELYAELFAQINERDLKPAYLIAEIGSNNWRDFLRLAKKYFPAVSIEIKKDYANRPRILIIKF